MSDELPTLRVVAGGRRVTVRAGQPFIIGRGDGAHLTLADPLVSRHHAVVEHSEKGWMLTDVSRNGTFFDGERVTQVRVNRTTTLRLGGEYDGERIQLIPDSPPPPDEPIAGRVTKQGRLSVWGSIIRLGR